MPKLQVPELKFPENGAEVAKGAVGLAASVLETAPKRSKALKPPPPAKASVEVSTGSALIAAGNVGLLLGVPLSTFAALAYLSLGPK